MIMKYNEQRDKAYLEKLNKLIDDLPNICRKFFIGIENRTSVRTRIAYAYDLKLFFYYFIVVNKKLTTPISYDDIDAITSVDIEEYFHWLSGYEINDVYYANNESAKARKMCSLSTFYKYYLKKGYIKNNPMFAIDKIKRHEKEIIRLNSDEKQVLLDTVTNGSGLSKKQMEAFKQNKIRDYAMIAFFLETGMRVSELTGIDIDDIDFIEHKVRIIRKGGNYAPIYISDKAEEIIKEYITLYRSVYVPDDSEEKALFVTRKGTRMAIRTVEVMLKKYTTTALLQNITPHKLRSTYGTDLYNKTGDIYVVAETLGHKDVNTTKKHYASVSEARKKSVRNALHE